jgi:hypothetical protein
MNRFRTIVFTAIAGLVLVACGPAASTSSSESAAAQASQAASQAAQSSAGGNLPSFTEGAVANLEALIPGTAGGVTLTKASMQGNAYLLSGNPDPTTVKFLQDLGVSPSDVSMAYGIGFSSDASTTVVMFVFRAKGADSGHLLAAFKTSTDAGSASPLQWTSSTLGGKQVETADNSGQTSYLYVKGDTLFFVSASTKAIAESILSGLP